MLGSGAAPDPIFKKTVEHRNKILYNDKYQQTNERVFLCSTMIIQQNFLIWKM
jgi:hypothetical protein